MWDALEGAFRFLQRTNFIEPESSSLVLVLSREGKVLVGAVSTNRTSFSEVDLLDFALNQSLDETSGPQVIVVASRAGLRPSLLELLRLSTEEGIIRKGRKIALVLEEEEIRRAFELDSEWSQTLRRWTSRSVERRDVEGSEEETWELTADEFANAAPQVLLEEATGGVLRIVPEVAVSLDDLGLITYGFLTADKSTPSNPALDIYPAGGYLGADRERRVVTSDLAGVTYSRSAVGVDLGFVNETALVRVGIDENGTYEVADSTAWSQLDVEESIDRMREVVSEGDSLFCDSLPRPFAKTIENRLHEWGVNVQLVNLRAYKGKMDSYLKKLISLGRLRVPSSETALLSELTGQGSTGHYDRLVALQLACYGLRRRVTVPSIKRGMIKRRVREGLSLEDLMRGFPEVEAEELQEIYWSSQGSNQPVEDT